MERLNTTHFAHARRSSAALVGWLAAALLAAAAPSPAHAQPAMTLTETFDDTSLRDETQTRADWGVSVPGELRLPRANALADAFGPATLAEDMLGTRTTRVLSLADLNGDGRLDLLEGSSGQSGAYLNNGDGTFAARIDFEAGTANTRGIAAGDVDLDGDIDVVVGNLGAASRVYLNAGDGITYTAADLSPDVRQTDWIVLADFNGDGFLDAATANHNSSNRIYFNTGDPQQPFGATGVAGVDLGTENDNTQALAAGDVDKDGDVDLVALNENEVNVLYLNDGSGAFTAVPIGTDADNSQAGALGDLNGDGFLDLVVVNGLMQVSKIYFNTGSPAPFDGVAGTVFTSMTDLDHARAVVLADADNDGDLDIFLSTAEEVSPAAHENFLYLNDGAGALAAPIPIGVETDITNALAVGDVDGDGDLDLIAGNEMRDALGTAGPAVNRIYRNNGTDAGAGEVLQLDGVATSLRVDSETVPISRVGLTVSPETFGALNDVEFWVSSNGGVNWLQIVPGRTVDFPVALQGQDMRWRAVMRSLSPAAEGGAAGLALDTVTLTLDGPAFTSAPPTTATVGVEYSYAVAASGEPGSALTITAPTLPAWLTLTDNGDGTATLAGTPDASQVGDHAVELVVQSDAGISRSQPFTISVSEPAPDQTPTITLAGDASMTLDRGATFTDPGATASDPEDGDLTAAIVVTNPVDTATAGTYTVTYTVQDSAGNSAQAERTVIVQAPAQNQNPPATNNPPPSNPTSGGGGGGGGGAAGLLELLGMLLIVAVRLVRRPRHI